MAGPETGAGAGDHQHKDQIGSEFDNQLTTSSPKTEGLGIEQISGPLSLDEEELPPLDSLSEAGLVRRAMDIVYGQYTTQINQLPLTNPEVEQSTTEPERSDLVPSAPLQLPQAATIVDFGGMRFRASERGVLTPDGRYRSSSLPRGINRIAYDLNRLPTADSGAGGAITAGKPITLYVDEYGNPVPIIWIGADYTSSQESIDNFIAQVGNHVRVVPVKVGDRKKSHKEIISDTVLWFANHPDHTPKQDLISYASSALTREDFETWDAVQYDFARETAEVVDEHTIVMMNDYQLYTAPTHLRKLRPKQLITTYIHTPFATPEHLAILDKIGPDAKQRVLGGILSCNVAAFSTEENRQNFIDSVKIAFPEYQIEDGVVNDKHYVYVHTPERRVVLAVTPIGIDTTDFEQEAQRPEIQEEVAEIRKRYPGQIISNYARLEPEKDHPGSLATLVDFYKLQEFKQTLGMYTGNLHYFLSAAKGSRTTEPYMVEAMKLEAQKALLKAFDDPQTGWEVLHHIYGLPQKPLPESTAIPRSVIGLNGATHILHNGRGFDGFRLTPDEFWVTSGPTGIVILSSATGAAKYDQGAIIVDPTDDEAQLYALETAVNMPDIERRRRHDLGYQTAHYFDIFNHYDLIMEAAQVAQEYELTHAT